MKITAETIVPSVDILNSWKEIASYLSRGVRTVQRWEAELGMPVRRPRGRGRSAVIAIRSELDQWIKSCPLEAQHDAVSDGVIHDVTWTLFPAVEQLRDSTLQLRQLRTKVTDSRKQLSVALAELAVSVEKMTKNSWGGAPNGNVLARLPKTAPAVSSSL